MRTRAIAAAAALIVTASSAHAAEIDAMITTAMKAAVDELAPPFERADGHKQGKVVGGRTDVARTGIGIAVRKGAPKPDVSSPEALRRAMLAAKSIAHTAPAGGGVTAAHVMGVFAKLGIAAEVARRSSSRPAAPMAASACWSRVARPRSGCSSYPS